MFKSLIQFILEDEPIIGSTTPGLNPFQKAKPTDTFFAKGLFGSNSLSLGGSSPKLWSKSSSSNFMPVIS
jgi:hypothetical protein